jgi:hypothetical protein
MKSDATTPAEYIASVDPERQPAIKKLRQVLRKNLPPGFQETMGYGMLAYVVPHSIFPAGYHCDPKRPLPFINLASQKQYVSLYHMGLYDGPLLEWLKREWPKHTAMKLDVGKCCMRFRKIEEIPYDLIGQLAAKVTPAEWISSYESATGSGGKPSSQGGASKRNVRRRKGNKR